jgi:phosphoglucomutase
MSREEFEKLPFTDEQRKYVSEKLNPWMEAMVHDCMREMPEDVGEYLYNWCQKRKSNGGAGSGSSQQLSVENVPTKPIKGQAPGTSGLRKKTKEFMSENYLANYVQSVFNTLIDENVPVKGGTLVVSGDGRYWNPECIQIIIKIAFANGVGRIWCGKDGLLSTPATSAVIRCRGKGFEPFGGFICSASHNPGGIDQDFGIKYNCENGGPAPEKMTDIMIAWTAKINTIKMCTKLPTVDVSKVGVQKFGDRTVEVFDETEDHLSVLKSCFDFDSIKRLMTRPDFTMTYDCMCGVQGPYARKILEGELCAKAGTCKNADPKPDFGGPTSAWHGHADPNLTYAVELVASMGLNKEGNKISVSGVIPNFGAAADGDADRNMILSSQFFISPSDSVAMIVANAHLIPQFKNGVKGCARSMPTSAALDRVAQQKGYPFFEVPTGWKFFGNLMDSGIEKYFPGK